MMLVMGCRGADKFLIILHRWKDIKKAQEYWENYNEQEDA
jgi:hypothetical protein